MSVSNYPQDLNTSESKHPQEYRDKSEIIWKISQDSSTTALLLTGTDQGLVYNEMPTICWIIKVFEAA